MSSKELKKDLLLKAAFAAVLTAGFLTAAEAPKSAPTKEAAAPSKEAPAPAKESAAPAKEAAPATHPAHKERKVYFTKEEPGYFFKQRKFAVEHAKGKESEIVEMTLSEAKAKGLKHYPNKPKAPADAPAPKPAESAKAHDAAKGAESKK